MFDISHEFQNHGKSDSVVVAELSDAADSERLLRLIDERKIRTVISLQDIDHTVPYDIVNILPMILWKRKQVAKDINIPLGFIEPVLEQQWLM